MKLGILALLAAAAVQAVAMEPQKPRSSMRKPATMEEIRAYMAQAKQADREGRLHSYLGTLPPELRDLIMQYVRYNQEGTTQAFLATFTNNASVVVSKARAEDLLHGRKLEDMTHDEKLEFLKELFMLTNPRGPLVQTAPMYFTVELIGQKLALQVFANIANDAQAMGQLVEFINSKTSYGIRKIVELLNVPGAWQWYEGTPEGQSTRAERQRAKATAAQKEEAQRKEKAERLERSAERRKKADEAKAIEAQAKIKDNRPRFDAADVARVYAYLNIPIGATRYQILGVDPKATPQEIRKAYRTLAAQWHPDKNSNPDAGKVFQLVTWAYESLTKIPTNLERSK